MSMQEKPCAWVFGASGLTGQGIVKSLTFAGVPTYAHLRPNSSSYDHVVPRFEENGAFVKVIAWVAADIRAALKAQPPTIVFLALGTTRARSKVDGQGYQTVDYGYTKMVIDCILADHPTCKLVYISAIPGGSSAYFKVRTAIEKLLVESGRPQLIARPSLIIGDRLDRRPWERRAAWLMDGCLSCLRTIGLGSVSDRFTSMTGDQLGAGVVQLCLEDATDSIVEVAQIKNASERFRRR